MREPGRGVAGRGLRQQILGVYRFFGKIRARLPDLVIENCSSGGQRLEPSLLALTAMSSFSDAHETPEIPLIAANLHRLILPRQNQIWAVLHRSDSDRRLIYSLAATFLGRMCLSGEIDKLEAGQLALVREAQQAYLAATPIIKSGTSRRHGRTGESWRHPQGWQAVVRTGDDGKSALIVIHLFAQAPAEIRIPLPPGNGWRITKEFLEQGMKMSLEGSELIHRSPADFSAAVILLARD